MGCCYDCCCCCCSVANGVVSLPMAPLLFLSWRQCKHNLESALGDSSMTKASPEYVKVSGRSLK